jgi:hypothetical protein
MDRKMEAAFGRLFFLIYHVSKKSILQKMLFACFLIQSLLVTY